MSSGKARRSPRMLSSLALAFLVMVATTAYAVPIVSFTIHKKRLRNEQQFTDERMSYRAIGLRGMYIGFDGIRQRKLSKMGFWPSGNRFHSVLKDKNGGEAYTVTADYTKLPLTGADIRRVAKKKNCTASCRLRMEKPRHAKDMVFLLSGFELTRAGNKETNIKQVKIRPNYAGQYIDVAFSNGKKAKFDVEVTYFLMPRAAFTSVGSAHASKGKRGNSTLAVGPKAKGNDPLLIRGFDLRFTKASRPFGRLSITRATRAKPLTVQFTDADGAELVDVVIDYAQVNGKWAKSKPR